MFDNLGNTERAANENGQPKRTNAHPLAALQKLCDKTENNPSRSNTSGQSTALLSASPSLQNNNRTGAILAFSWACSDGIMADESNIKCAYCDTTFSSKGAYRHHLSKAHFVNDDAINEGKSNAIKLTPTLQSPKSPHSPKSNNSGNGNGLALPLIKKSPSPVATQSSNTHKSDMSTTSSSSSTAFDESPHSKFLKYTELAKQLSSKYV
jgi:uncharacterized C2H2 Zn-finger protein